MKRYEQFFRVLHSGQNVRRVFCALTVMAGLVRSVTNSTKADFSYSALSTVMPALVAGIHVFPTASKTWMAGTSPAMTNESAVQPCRPHERSDMQDYCRENGPGCRFAHPGYDSQRASRQRARASPLPLPPQRLRPVGRGKRGGGVVRNAGQGRRGGCAAPGQTARPPPPPPPPPFASRMGGGGRAATADSLRRLRAPPWDPV